MTKFELMFNGTQDLRGKNIIDCIITDINKDETFSANLIANNLSEIDSKLPQGFELDRITTLQNYFNPVTVSKYEIELYNSQTIYFSDFQELYNGEFQNYIKALENDNMNLINALDRRFQK